VERSFLGLREDVRTSEGRQVRASRRFSRVQPAPKIRFSNVESSSPSEDEGGFLDGTVYQEGKWREWITVGILGSPSWPSINSRCFHLKETNTTNSLHLEWSTDKFPISYHLSLHRAVVLGSLSSTFVDHAWIEGDALAPNYHDCHLPFHPLSLCHHQLLRQGELTGHCWADADAEAEARCCFSLRSMRFRLDSVCNVR